MTCCTPRSSGRGGGAWSRACSRPTATDSLEQPNRYRLATSGPLRRDLLPECLEEWAGQPFFFAAGDPFRSQALWSFAHGMVILEIDGRYPDGSDLDRTWRGGRGRLRGMTAVSPMPVPSITHSDRTSGPATGCPPREGPDQLVEGDPRHGPGSPSGAVSALCVRFRGVSRPPPP